MPTKPTTNLEIDIRVVAFSLRNKHLSVLLSACSDAVFSEKWELPGCEVQEDEALEKTASRCLSSTVGKGEFYLEQLYTYGDLDRHPEKRRISVVYYALIPAHIPAKGQCPQWFEMNALPALAADHASIVEYALRRLQYKLEYSAVGFELLPENFTLSELQHTYELILGETLDKRNFRRRILAAGIIEPIAERKMGEGRPAQMYRYRPDAIAEVKARRLFP